MLLSFDLNIWNCDRNCIEMGKGKRTDNGGASQLSSEVRIRGIKRERRERERNLWDWSMPFFSCDCVGRTEEV